MLLLFRPHVHALVRVIAVHLHSATAHHGHASTTGAHHARLLLLLLGLALFQAGIRLMIRARADNGSMARMASSK
jgi:hypothetical protein